MVMVAAMGRSVAEAPSQHDENANDDEEKGEQGRGDVVRPGGDFGPEPMARGHENDEDDERPPEEARAVEEPAPESEAGEQ